MVLVTDVFKIHSCLSAAAAGHPPHQFEESAHALETGNTLNCIITLHFPLSLMIKIRGSMIHASRKIEDFCEAQGKGRAKG